MNEIEERLLSIESQLGALQVLFVVLHLIELVAIAYLVNHQ
jgi:hypothetical protein